MRLDKLFSFKYTPDLLDSVSSGTTVGYKLDGPFYLVSKLLAMCM